MECLLDTYADKISQNNDKVLGASLFTMYKCAFIGCVWTCLYGSELLEEIIKAMLHLYLLCKLNDFFDCIPF